MRNFPGFYEKVSQAAIEMPFSLGVEKLPHGSGSNTSCKYSTESRVLAKSASAVNFDQLLRKNPLRWREITEADSVKNWKTEFGTDMV